MDKMQESNLPPSSEHQVYVTLAAFAAGFITLPENSFVSPSQNDAHRTVPSLSFLIQHLLPNGRHINILFDLGLRSSEDDYTAAQQLHLHSRRPFSLRPGIASQLKDGGINAAQDIDLVILSHVHYDHHGDPDDFRTSKFIVGPGSCHVLEHGLPGNASHQRFQSDLLPRDRTAELPSTDDHTTNVVLQLYDATFVSAWQPVGPFSHGLDIFGDRSIYIINSPGHLPGHINLLCRTGPGAWVYLAGDACHDRQILTGEKQIATWQGSEGQTCCIHVDKEMAERTLTYIRDLLSLTGETVEVILAHDWQWYEENQGRSLLRRSEL